MVSTILISDAPTSIAIIGAGFSGTLVAVHLLKTANRPLLIKLIERSPEIGKGESRVKAILRLPQRGNQCSSQRQNKCFSLTRTHVK